MRILAIWLVFSAPLILAVVHSIRAAAMPVEVEVVAPPEVSVSNIEPEFRSLSDVDENLLTRLVQFTWFDPAGDSDQGIQPANASAWSEQIKTASEQLLNLNRVVRLLVQSSVRFDDPVHGQQVLEEFVHGSSTDARLAAFLKRPEAIGVQQAVAELIEHKLTEKKYESLRETAQRSYLLARGRPNETAFDAIIESLTQLSEEVRTAEDREQIRWARFWKHWSPASGLGRSPVSPSLMISRRDMLQGLLNREEQFPPVNEDEHQVIETARKEIPRLTVMIDFAEIRAEIGRGSPAVWLDQAEELFDKLDNKDREELRTLIRDALTRRIADIEAPNDRYQEAVTKNNEVLIGKFEYRGQSAGGRPLPNPYYKFVSAAGVKNNYLYANTLDQTPQETFAVLVYNQISQARQRIVSSPHDQASWRSLLTLITELQERQERYLKLKFVAGQASRETVTDELASLKLEETQIVCDALMHNDTWSRVMQLITPQR